MDPDPRPPPTDENRFRRSQSGQQHADVRRFGDRGAGHDRVAGGRRGRGTGAETRPAESRAAPVQAGHAGRAQTAVDRHETPERLQDRGRLVVPLRPRRHCRQRSRGPRVRGQRQLVRVPRAVQAAAVGEEPRLRADHVPVQEGRVRAHHQQEQRVHRSVTVGFSAVARTGRRFFIVFPPPVLLMRPRVDINWLR